MAANGRNPVVCYIYEIPYTTRRRLCMVLDGGGEWKTLAGELNYSADYVRYLELALMRPGGSPTDDLLNEWSQSMATVTSLFRYLRHMKHYRALSILKDLVPEEMYQDIELCDTVSEERDVRQPSYINEVNRCKEQRHTSELPAPELPHFPIQDQENIPKTTKAGENGDEGSNAISYTDNFAYTGSTEIQTLAQQKSLKDATQKRPVESLDTSFRSGKGDLTTLDVRHDKSGLAHMGNAQLELKAWSQSTALVNTQHFTYSEISQATYGFHDHNLIGKGGFGTVYKGILKKTLFAIKLLKNRLGKTDVKVQQQHHMAEIETLLRYRHDNIIQLCGYSMDGPQVCLVYQYMENGSLENRLACKVDLSIRTSSQLLGEVFGHAAVMLQDGTKPLGWALRHHILTGSARGIQYLHSVDKTPLIHGDIKSANILLDRHFDPKVADFGLAKQATGQSQSGQFTHVSRKHRDEKVFGSIAYLPDEFFGSYQFSIKTDTYSFGVVVYETCTGEQALEEKREGGHKLKDYIDKLWGLDNQDEFQKRLQDKKAADWPPQSWDALMRLGLECTRTKKKDRPIMQNVLSRLERIEADIQAAPVSAASMSEVFTQFSYASEGQGLNNLAPNVENGKMSQLDPETIPNSEANQSDPSMLQYDHSKLELDSSDVDVSGNVVDSEDCIFKNDPPKLELDSAKSTCSVTTSDRRLDQSCDQTPDQKLHKPGGLPGELDEEVVGLAEITLVDDELSYPRSGRTSGEESIQLQGLMEDISRLGVDVSRVDKDISRPGVDVSSHVEEVELTSDSAEISRKSLKKRPQFVNNIFSTVDGLDDQFNGVDPMLMMLGDVKSQLAHGHGEQPVTESTDLYGPPFVGEKMGATSQKSTK